MPVKVETVLFRKLCVGLRASLCGVLHGTPPRRPSPALTLRKIPRFSEICIARSHDALETTSADGLSPDQYRDPAPPSGGDRGLAAVRERADPAHRNRADRSGGLDRHRLPAGT